MGGGYYFGTNEFEDEFQKLIDTFKLATEEPSEDKVIENETPICSTKEFENVCKELGLEED